MGQWIRSLGQLEPDVAFGVGKPIPPRTLPQAPEIEALAVDLKRSEGDRADPSDARKAMTALRHSAALSRTPVLEGEAPMRLGAHLPGWLLRA